MKYITYKNGVSRRDFLKGCSYVAAAAILGGCDSKTKGYIPDYGDDDIGDDSYSFNIHPSADVLDSVQTFVKFQTNKLEAVVESSQPMFMLTASSGNHDGSFNPLAKTYGHPEILHLDNNADGNTYVEINMNSHENNIGLVKEKINIGPTREIERSNGLSYTYNDIVACNGSKHNSVNEETGKFISQKMAIVAANSKMGLGDDWNSIEQWYYIMTDPNNKDAIENQAKLIYQYEEVDPIDPHGNSELSSSWETINLLDSLGSYWTEAIAYAKEVEGLYYSPLQKNVEFFLETYPASIEDISRYTDAKGNKFLYGTVSLGYFYSFGFIVSFSGQKPEVHWYISEELDFSVERLSDRKGTYSFEYSLRYIYLSRLFDEDPYIGKNDQCSGIDSFLDEIDKKTLEDNLGKCIYKPMAVVDDSVVMSYETFYIPNDQYRKKIDVVAYIQVPLKKSDNEVSYIYTQNADEVVLGTVLVPNAEVYNPNLNSFAVPEVDELPQNLYMIEYDESIEDSYMGLNVYHNSSTWAIEQFVFDCGGGSCKINEFGYSDDVLLDDSTSTQWYVEQGLIPQTEFSVSDYLGDDCRIEYGSNHHGVTTVYFIPKDPNKLTFEWRIDVEKYQAYATVPAPQPVAYGVKRVLPWDNYLHGSELLYVGLEQKHIAPLANGANAGSLRDLSHQSSSGAESYFYAFSDYLEKNWKLVELQNAPKEAPKNAESITKVKQKIHHATLVITDQNHNPVTLASNLHVEIRCNSAVAMQDVTNPDKIKKVHLNRTTSYLAKDDGQGHVKLQIDVGHEGDLLTAVDLHYRIVDAGESGIAAFASANPGSPEKILNISEDSLTTQWGGFNISYLLHERNASMDTLQPTAPSDTELIQKRYSDNFSHHYSSDKENLIKSTKDSFSKVANAAKPKEDTSVTFLKTTSELHNPLYAVRKLNGEMQNYSLSLGSFWDVVSDAINSAEQIVKSAAAAAAELVKKIKEAIHNLIHKLDNLFDDLTKGLTAALNGLISFCGTLLKATIAYATLIMDILKGLFDFSLAFDVGAGLRELIVDNFTKTDFGIYSILKDDMQAIGGFISDNKEKVSGASKHMNKVSNIPGKTEENTRSTRKANHSSATHNNHTKNQISQNINLGGVGNSLPSATFSSNGGCDSIGEDIKNIFADMADGVTKISGDIAQADLNVIGPDLTTMMQKLEGDLIKVADDAFGCIVSQVEAGFIDTLEAILNDELPSAIKVLLNDIIVPLFGLGDRKFEYSSDILFFIVGFAINIVSTVGTETMKIIAPNVDIDISKLLANKGEYEGKTAAICNNYRGMNSALGNNDIENDTVVSVLIAHFAVNFYMLPIVVLTDNEKSSEFMKFIGRFKVAMLGIEFISMAMKEIALLSNESEEKEDIEKALIAMKFMLKALRTIFPVVPKGQRGSVQLIYALGLIFTYCFDLLLKIDQKKALPIVTAILEIATTIVDEVFEVQTEEEPATPKELIVIVSTLMVLNAAIDITEIIGLKKEKPKPALKNK